MKKIILLFIFCSFANITFAQSKNQVSVGAKYHWYTLINRFAGFNHYGFFVDYFRNVNQKSAVGLELAVITNIHVPQNFDANNQQIALNYRRYAIQKSKIKFFYEGGVLMNRLHLRSNGYPAYTYTNLNNGSTQTSGPKEVTLYNVDLNLKIGTQIKLYKSINLLAKIEYQVRINNNIAPTLGIGYTF